MTAGYRLASAFLAAAMAFAAPGAAQRCENGGMRMPDLGFDQLGGSISMSQTNDDRPLFEFGGEPLIDEVRGNGPAAGRLRDGDAIVAVDGQLITTREGARRWNAIDPGDLVRLSIRRGGRVQDVTIRTGVRCMPMPEAPAPPAPPARPGRPGTPAAPGAPPTPPRPPAGASGVRAPAPPRPSRPAPEPPPARPPRPGRPETPAAPPTPPAPPAPPEIMPDGWFGFGIQCNRCDIQVGRDRLRAFRFHEQPRVVNVEPGTPAARAGLQRGDVLTHVDGMSITSQPGWTRFASLQPGDQVRWTYVRDGRAHNATMTALRRPDAGRTPAPAAPGGGQRLRYSGSVGGSRVEVRGAPVNVSTDPRTGEMIIRSADLTVRIQPDRR